MKENSPELVVLFDIYGAMLTDKQRELFDLYHNEDLSLAEIAENVGISRQGVRDTLVRAENLLLDYEDKLGFSKRFGGINENLAKIERAARDIKSINAQSVLSVALDDRVREILDIVDRIAEE